MDKEGFQKALKTAIESQGGTLQNAWVVAVKQRNSRSKDVRITTAEGKVFQSVEQANLAFTVENGTEADGEQPTAAAEASKMEGEPSSDTNCKAANFEESAEAAKPHAQPKEDAAADCDATNAEAASADQEEAGDDHGATPDEQGGRDASKAVPAPQVSLRRSVRVKETAQPAKENKKGGKKHKGKAPKGKQQVLSEKLETAAKAARTRAKKQAADEDMNEAPAGKAPRKGNDASAAKTLAKKAAASRNPAKRESQEQNASDVEEPAKEAAQLRRSSRGQKRKEPVDADSKQDGLLEAKKPKVAEMQQQHSEHGGKPKRHASKPVQEGPAKEHVTFGNMMAKAKGHVLRIRREMDFLEVYRAEGWRGANKDKLKPSAEIQRAEQQIEKSKSALRQMLIRCEQAEGRPIPKQCYDENGDLDQEHIFCAVCDRDESRDDDDIVLCDGPCGRAYHEKCVVPNLSAADLPEDVDWLCPACHAKDEILDMISEAFEFRYELDCKADSVFISCGSLLRKDSAAGDASPRKEGAGTWAYLLGRDDLLSSDSDDEDFAQANCGSEATSGTESEEEEEETLIESREFSEGEQEGGTAEDEEGAAAQSMAALQDLYETDAEIVEGKRAHKTVDYITLNKDMFGDIEDLDNQTDSDNDWS